MTNLYKKLNTESDHIRLTADEKQALRVRIFGEPSSVTVTRSPYVFFASHRFLTALAALVLVVFAGGSTAFAARGALPGEPLYGLKTKVLEPVAVALASTPAAKAQVETQLASRRVAEAQTLAARGTLDATTTQQLEDNFNEHAASALALVGEEQPAAATTTGVAPAKKAKGHTLRAMTALEAATTSEATSSAVQETAATSTPTQAEGEDIQVSIEKQRGILDELKVQVGEQHSAGRGRGN